MGKYSNSMRNLFDFNSKCVRTTTNEGLIIGGLTKSEKFSKITFLSTTSDSLSALKTKHTQK